jgi:hypothetical protein
MMRFRPLFLLPALCLGLAVPAAPAQTTPPAPPPPAADAPAPAVTAPTVAAVAVPLTGHDPVWEAELPAFDDASYSSAIEALISSFEKATGKALVPGVKKKVGLKVYTDSGPGLQTPAPMVRAVIAALQRRGFENKNIFIVVLNSLRARMTGYLPSLVTGKTPFEGNPIYVLESGRFYDPVWFYDSPLPERFDPVFAAAQTRDSNNSSTKDEDRKSFLDTILFLEADFWINMPVYTDHPILGINGALVNATLWNASNTARFFRSPATAPAAVAEMSAIPELRETWMCTIASLQEYQYIGGPYFNSLYTRSEPRVWLSNDPVMMDSLMRDRIDRARRKEGFEPISDDIRTLEDAESLGVGSTRTAGVHIIRVN